MELTLLLNATYEPLPRGELAEGHHPALAGEGRAVLEVYDREIPAVSISFKLPAVMGC